MMMRKFYIVFILIAFISCSKQRIIPEETLVEIVYKMYITDAVLVTHSSSILLQDSMKIYEPLVEKFGYNFDDLRRTFLQYTAQDGKLQSVLDKVNQKIAAEKEIYQPIARIEKLSENMNVGADSISVVSRTVNKHNIEVKLSEQGVYDVSASYFFYKNDSTKNPRMSVWLESRAHKDSIMDKQEISLVKDTVFNDYSARVKFNNPDFNILKIYWLDFDKKTDTVKQKSATQRNADKRTNSRQKPNAKIKPDTTTRQHYTIKRMSVKYNFEESDTTRLKEFIGPVLPDFDNEIKIKDSVSNPIDSVERIMAIKKEVKI
jgi:hypothetical protein